MHERIFLLGFSFFWIYIFVLCYYTPYNIYVVYFTSMFHVKHFVMYDFFYWFLTSSAIRKDRKYRRYGCQYEVFLLLALDLYGNKKYRISLFLFYLI